MRIAIVGSRAFQNCDVVSGFVGRLPKGSIVISGGAKGVDSWAAKAAREAGLETLVLEADWERHGRSAGPIRNHEIVKRSDEVAAFWDGSSRGTLNTVALAVRESIPVRVYGAKGEALDLAEVMAVATAKGIVATLERALSRKTADNK